MTHVEEVRRKLRVNPKRWLVTGCAGFIGSNLLETLLQLDQAVVGIDNFGAGLRSNLDEVRELVDVEQWARFTFIEGDICDINACKEAVRGIDCVLHQAALGSVPRSLEDPVGANHANVNGFLNFLVAARDASVASFVYATSSAAYGDHPGLRKVEDSVGKPLSPYAVTKYVNELYAEAFARCYGFKTIGLRYFNVFGKRQHVGSAYAAVIPKWITAMIRNDEVVINGDGKTSRDFCFVENVIQANLLAATTCGDAKNDVYNVGVGDAITLERLFEYLKSILNTNGVCYSRKPTYREFRKGDVMHSQADISKAVEGLGYAPEYGVREGLAAAVPWYLKRYQSSNLR